VTFPRLRSSCVQSVVREAFAMLGAGRAVQPLQVVTDLPGGGDVIAYQAVLADSGVYAVRGVPYRPQPDGRAIVTAWTLLLSRRRSGEPVLLVDSAGLTTERTAATTAVAVDLLAGPDATLACRHRSGQGRAGAPAPRARACVASPTCASTRGRLAPAESDEPEGVRARRRARRRPRRAPTSCCCAPRQPMPSST
jgi:L-arginine dehydrogenase